MQFLRFDSLSTIPSLRHAITTRGDNSDGSYDELNLAYHVGDEVAHVNENRQKIAAKLGYKAADLVAAQQVHGIKTWAVTESIKGRGAFDWDSAIPDCDALIVEDAQIPVLIQVADCAPVLIVDSKNHVLSVVHAGWRGAVEGIVGTQVFLINNLHTGIDTKDFLVGIGPCLCTNCFEIGTEVVEAAQKIAPEVVIQRSDWQKPHLDLRLLIQRDLESIGVPTENIEIMARCPKCENETFFSHRGQNGTAGRFGLIAWWDN